ncbi:nuclear pore complex protein DDB_G0274915-like [Leptopilina boulardi]|uniref:nuclear pore complex protein DDB_G0274915-like n=1 Tax=Leptopilina boulardi TaxID=63433 RepID=UPI0021F69593|nr:nuclear pore complex protein DDB_G0274915-like [Leptopilina boulardi]XP_051172160.1 nuclear pore complex protein DDB_G0274915-like [Leptopilina boulardi]
MWEIGNRGAVGLLSVFIGSVVLYNAWGLILVLAILLFLVVNTCYSLLVNDSLVSPYNLLVFRFARRVILDISSIIEQVSVLLTRYIRDFVNAGKRYYRQRFNSSHSSNMNRSRRSSYHLSSESLVKARDPSSSSFSSTNVNQLSPIPKEKFQQIDDWNEHTRYVESNESLVKYTSTPLVPWRKENVPNGEPQNVSIRNSPTKVSPLQGRNHTLSRDETFFSPEGSPWGTSISPKMRAKAAGVKTVQTVAGPLLASTRYNIDTKVYTDVTSPGLTTRLSKYASEISSKLLQQPQYGMGHFPKVNLNASPTPLINTKTAKMRMPVTVRIAQPEAIRYSPSERRKMLSMTCHSDSQISSPNVVQALREISLKRHASREDVTSDFVKKQRTDVIYSDELENLEEMTQKRARDESSKSDEELSPSHSGSRPLKRTKGQSCNDILNSFSSSVHVFSGVKRKATDISRSNTPDIEKHFKSLKKYPSEGFTTVSQEAPKFIERHTSEPLTVVNVPMNFEAKSKKEVLPKEIVSINVSQAEEQNKSPDAWEIKRPTILKKPKSPTSPVKLSDKLFMRPAPQNNDKLRTIIEQQSNVKDKFSMADQDEIKKMDIVNMRQTSMRARLQSMFDAISGKGASKINPDVVIQAGEEKNNVCDPTSTPFTTLSSTTVTTNVNTSPISSPVVPILKKGVTKKSPNKRVTFNLPSSVSSSSLSTENVVSKPQAIETPDTPAVGFLPSTASSGTASTFTLETSTSTIPILAPTSNIVDSSKEDISCASNFMASKTENTTSIFSSKTPQDLKTNLSLPVTQNSVVSAPSQNVNFSSLQNTNLATSQNLNTTQSVTTPSFTFGAVAKSPEPAQTFGQNTAVNSENTPISLPSSTFSAPNFNSTSTTSLTPTFSFGASKPMENIPKTQPTAPFGLATTSFSFPTNATPTSSASNLNKVETTSTESKTSTFSFGNTSVSKPGFSFSTTTGSAPIFGANNSSSSTLIAGNPINPTTAAPAFGLATKSTPSFTSPSFGAGSNCSLNFGTSNANEVKSFGIPTTTSSLFGTTTSTTAVSFKSINSQPIFGNASSATPSAFRTPKTTASSIFVSNSTPTFGTSTTSTPSLFTNSNVNTTTSNLFSQGNQGANADSASTPFGTNVATNVTSSNPMLGGTSNIFSQTKPPAFGSTSSTFANTGTSLFGTASTNPGGFNATSPGNSATSAFGSATSTTLFGAQNTGTTPAVSQNSSFGFSTTIANTPAFGTTATSSAFGSGANNSFQTQNNNNNNNNNASTGISFGAGSNNNNTPSFGSSSTTGFGTQAGSVFGTSTPGPAFGAAANSNTNGNSTNANASGAFTFGTSQNQTQPGSTFSFGGASTNTSNNNNAATPFQFGSPVAKPASGFNFTAPSAGPSINFGASTTTTFNAPAPGTSNFTAPAGGMFSIGTGSTAPRSRTARSRRQR